MKTISVTERQTYKRCRRQWALHKEGLKPIAPKIELELGTLVHKALADWLVNPDLNPEVIFDTLSIESIQVIQDNYRSRVGYDMLDAELDPLIEMMLLGKAMMRNYAAHHKAPLPQGYTMMSVEQQVLIPINRLTKLEATFDALLTHNDRIFILEHKTYSSRPNIQSLQMNDQFTAYLWALQKLNIGKVGGVLYDGLWKRDDPPRGKMSSDLFMRMTITRPQAALNEFSRTILMEAKEMTSRITGIYPNRRWEGCYDCHFEELCTAMTNGEDVNYIRRNKYVQS